MKERKMRKIPLQSGIIYGPVSSRRLGSSLGINLTPSLKICSFDCVYCQYGKTPQKLLTLPVNTCGLPTPDQVALELKEWFKSHPKENPNYITFCGNGEPSLHPQFEVIVRMVKQLRNKFAPQSKLAILSNASTLEREDVQRALRELDLRIMKLDVGDEESFSKINQPHPSIRFEKLVHNLRKTKGVIILPIPSKIPQTVTNVLIQYKNLTLFLERIQ